MSSCAKAGSFRIDLGLRENIVSSLIAVVTTPATSAAGIRSSLSSLMRDREVIEVGDLKDLDAHFAAGQVSAVISASDAPDEMGAKYFEVLSAEYPRIIRILIAEDAAKSNRTYGPGTINRIFPTDSSPEEIAEAIENSERLRDLLMSHELTNRVSAIRSLPALPKTYKALRIELNKDDASVQTVAELIKQDVGITAKVLQIINSAFFGLRTQVENPLQAVGLLGFDAVENLVLAAGVFAGFDDPGIPGLSLESIYDSCLEVGGKTRHISSLLGLDRFVTEDAVVSGFLHALGLVVLMTEFPEELQLVIDEAEAAGISLLEAQQEVLGVTHAEIGAYLLSQWGFGDHIVEAIADHYRPSRVARPVVNGLTAVHIAYALHCDANNGARDEQESALDMEYIDALGLSSQLAYLKKVCLAMK